MLRNYLKDLREHYDGFTLRPYEDDLTQKYHMARLRHKRNFYGGAALISAGTALSIKLFFESADEFADIPFLFSLASITGWISNWSEMEGMLATRKTKTSKLEKEIKV